MEIYVRERARSLCPSLISLRCPPFFRSPEHKRYSLTSALLFMRTLPQIASAGVIFPSASGILAGWKTRAARPNKNGLVVYASAAIIKRKEPIIRISLLATGYRLCVYASGSLITVILKGKPVSVSFNSFIMLPASAGHRNNWPWPLRR